MRRFIACLVFTSLFFIIRAQEDEIVTEVVSNEMLDMGPEEMAAMDDDVLHVDFSLLMKEPVMREPACLSGKTEIVFLLDGSSQVSMEDFVQLRDWLMLLVETYDLAEGDDAAVRSNELTNQTAEGSEKTRVSFVQFSDTSKIEMGLDDYSSRMEVWDIIGNIERLGGSVNVSEAIDFVRGNVLNESRSGALKIVVMVTSNNCDSSLAAARLKQTGVRFFAVGVGDDVTRADLELVTSEPAKKFAYHVKGYEDLESIRKKLKWKICQETKHKANIDKMPPKANTRCGCKDGDRGKPGPAGDRGTTGHRGDRGEKGNPGKVGLRGKSGAKGDIGPPGPPGPPGAGTPTGPPAGPKSLIERDVSPNEDLMRRMRDEMQAMIENINVSSSPGIPGMKGDAGQSGMKGEAGPPGAIGKDGDYGIPGLDGADGSPGLTGPPGPPGPKGEPGTNGGGAGAPNGKSFSEDDVVKIATRVCQAMIQEHESRTNDQSSSRSSRQRFIRGPSGPPGPRGYPGPPGSQGYEGQSGSRGFPGIDGAKGSRGAMGPIGDKGERGLPGIGVRGPSGPPGATGPPGRARHGDNGAPGPQGERGPRGKRGLKGANGKSGSPGRCSNQQCSSLRRRRSIDSISSEKTDRQRKWWPWQ